MLIDLPVSLGTAAATEGLDPSSVTQTDPKKEFKYGQDVRNLLYRQKTTDDDDDDDDDNLYMHLQ